MKVNLSSCSKEEIYNLAYNYEKHSVNMYSKLTNIEICSEILKIKECGLKLLKENSNYKLDEFSIDFYIDDEMENNLFFLISFELKLCKFYEQACACELDEDVRDLFYRLWATSHNEYIPTLKSYLFTQNSMQNNTQNYTYNNTQSADNSTSNNEDDSQKEAESLNDFIKKAEEIYKGNSNPEAMLSLVNHPNFSFFGGLALGGLLTVGLNEILKKDKGE